jgi:hypothetical protein
MSDSRGGLAAQILVGFFFEGPPKNENADQKKKKRSLNKNYKGAIAAAQTGNSHKLSADLKKKKKVMMLGGPRLL